MEVVVFLLAAGITVGIIGVSVYLSFLAAKRRREALSACAQRLGLQYSPNRDYQIVNRFRFLNALRRGSNQYAFNTLSGKYKDYDVMVFDYHYETYSTDSKGRRQTHHHYFSFFVLLLAISCPELMIAKEGIFSKIAQAFGYDDIDFESHEFSRQFCVRSKDKKFAYDVCNARMINYLLENKDLSIEIEQDALAFKFAACLKLEQIEKNIERLLVVRSLLPEYLFSQSS